MQLHSIRFRLSAWYFGSMAVILVLFGFSAWFGMKSSMRQAVDHSLAVRLDDVRDFLDKELDVGPAELLDEFREQTQLGLAGGLFRITDETGAVLYSSPRFPVEASPRMRIASKNVRVHQKGFRIDVAEPLDQLEESLRRFERTILILGPLFLLAASVGGFWISLRALAPVDRITRDARRIRINNLSERLEVPSAKDELRGLAQTLNEMLERIDREVRRMVQFTADASHELRAPMTLIHTAAEFSVRRERTHDELVHALRTILRESERTSRLIDDLLEVARTDSGAAAVEFGSVDILRLAREASEEAVTLAAEKNIRVLTHLPDVSAVVAGDEQALSRAFLALLDNAVKYTAEDGQISFAIEVEDGTVKAVVRDTGIGIAAEDLPHVFDRFWRADKVRSRSAGGAGLGLSIAKSIVERHGGEISVQSTLGHGSEFVVRLPRYSQSLYVAGAPEIAEVALGRQNSH